MCRVILANQTQSFDGSSLMVQRFSLVEKKIDAANNKTRDG